MSHSEYRISAFDILDEIDNLEVFPPSRSLQMPGEYDFDSQDVFAAEAYATATAASAASAEAAAAAEDSSEEADVCAICMSEMSSPSSADDDSGDGDNVLFGCHGAHRFHRTCHVTYITHYNRDHAGKIPVCPVCRQLPAVTTASTTCKTARVEVTDAPASSEEYFALSRMFQLAINRDTALHRANVRANRLAGERRRAERTAMRERHALAVDTERRIQVTLSHSIKTTQARKRRMLFPGP